MKKLKICGVIVLIIVLISLFKIDNELEKRLRIRVIASSNSEVDQKIKYDCVEIVKRYINVTDDLSACKTKLKKLEQALNKEINTQDSIKVEIRKEEFPPKMLNGKLISGGIYDTIVISIGNKEGENYWTLLYPEYFGITYDDIKSENIIIKWFLSEKLKKRK